MSPRQKTNSFSWPAILRICFLVGSVLFLVLVGVEIYAVAWGSGHFLGRLSEKWIFVLGGFLLFGFALLAILFYLAYLPRSLNQLRSRLLTWRSKLERGHWVAAFLLAAVPAYFIFYSPWGSLFHGFFTRLLVFVLAVVSTTFFLERESKVLLKLPSFLLAGLLVGSFLVLAESLILVNAYPFALHWSEGNRLWDYSVLFGRTRYNFPIDQPIFTWIDPGRQSLWGLPFIIPGLPIWVARLWGAFLTTVPYALLGWFAFRPLKKARGQWLAFGLWALIFLNQGPIYTPLILSAILVVAARGKSLWLALALVFLAGAYAGASRFTWSFAPAIWAVMLTFGDGMLARGRLIVEDWTRAFMLAVASVLTRGLPILLGVIQGISSIFPKGIQTPIATIVPGNQTVQTLQGLQALANSQPYIWYRLLPNDIYGPGILLGLAWATAPVILLLIYLNRKGFWKTDAWQRAVMVGGLVAFLVVGLIASVKVGGGADLHNMDMFLVTLVILAGVAWEAGLAKSLDRITAKKTAANWLLVAAILIPAFTPMATGTPLSLPSKERTRFVLGRIQQKVACARKYGEVLFMDQRQLITFGEMGDLPLVVDYEKKFVMDQALAGNKTYFDQFESDLAANRFSLIVSEREGTLYKDLDQESVGDSLVEENNAWVHWVSTPLLHYYESVGNYKDAAVELFMPIGRNFECP